MACFLLALAMLAPVVLYCFESRVQRVDNPVGFLISCYTTEAALGFVWFLLERG